MESRREEHSRLTQFLESFFSERSIRWILGTGVLILLGSSLMLVTSRWKDYTPFWKYVVLVSYTALSFAAGRVSYFHLGLRRTGTVLLCLTVLLLPITFLALRWVEGGRGTAAGAGGLDLGVNLALLAGNLAVSAFLARATFLHLLRGSQPTFLLSHLLLCLLGAIAPGLGPEASRWAAVLAWGAFAIGSVKVTRHVFWLAEEHRAPRVLGFLPTLLLGGQFLSLFVLSFAPHLSLPWVGLGCVLVAVPVLSSADSLARVLRKRSGELVRPFPQTILIPLASGLILCAAGMCLAMAGIFPPHRPHALVPAAALFAVLMALVARRTRKEAFVWAMLLGLTVAYNFSPVFFVEMASRVVDLGARAVKESRLPLAFYGLTYLPLVSAVSLLGALAMRKGDRLFARPLSAFGVGLSFFLLAASFGHRKALFPVAVAMAGVFSLQAALFADRRLAVPAILSSVAAAFGFGSFGTQVLGLPLLEDLALLPPAILAALLLFPGQWIDRLTGRLTGRLPPPRRREGGEGLPGRGAWSPCQAASLALTLALAWIWLARHGLVSAGNPRAWPVAVLTAVLLHAHTLRWLLPLLGEAAIAFTGISLVLLGLDHGLSFESLVSASVPGLFLLWLAGRTLEDRTGLRLAGAFAGPCLRMGLIGLAAALVMVYLPAFFLETARAWTPTGDGLWWPCRILIVAWAFDAAYRTGNRALTLLGGAGILGLSGWSFLLAGGGEEWLPAVWAGAALAGAPAAALLRRRLERASEGGAGEATLASLRALALPAGWLVLAVEGLLAIGTLPVLTGRARLAGFLAVGGVLLLGALRRNPAVWRLGLVLLHGQALSLIARVAGGAGVETAADLFRAASSPAPLLVALAAVASLFLFDLPGAAPPGSGGPSRSPLLTVVHRASLRALAACLLLGTLALDRLTPLQAALAALTFALGSLAELRAACLKQDPGRVPGAGLVALAGIAYLVRFEVITFGRGISTYLVLGAGLLLHAAGGWARRRPRTGVLSDPFLRGSMVLPLAAVGTAVFRHLRNPETVWLGANSLAILLAGAFYFWRGLESRRKGLLALSAAILNLAILILGRELEWSDPQLFLIPVGASIIALVELLKREIPPRFHDPLRYAGALVILVSPTFHIVEGSWLHLFTLMTASVAVILASIGLRVRALLYAGTAFLLADVAAMVVRGTIDNPSFLWISGLALGGAVIALGAFCESRRESLLDHLRGVAALLESWE